MRHSPAVLGRDDVLFRTITVDDACRDISSFNRLKREVFVDEQGWHLSLLKDGSAVADDGFDGGSDFILAYTRARMDLVGGVRITRASDRFPHQEYFETFRLHAAVANLAFCLFTMNALVVARGWRGLPDCNHAGLRLTLGCELLCRAIAVIWSHHGRVILLSATPNTSYRLLKRVGFRVLDKPKKFDTAPFPIINMGLVLTEWSRFQQIQSPLVHFLPAITPSKFENSCADLFHQCEQSALGEFPS